MKNWREGVLVRKPSEAYEVSALEAKHWNPKCDESQAAEKDVQHDEDLEGSRNQRVHEVVMLRCSHAPVKSLPFTAGVVRVRVRP